ncbi:unnamed protein product [Clonostachys solani]|uniref:Uncharacterized protein n=1 Tax=Clonostachys solani TaxID=160281 RepID=A0A9N9Z658_9HYPO|nr:unnamed protein product [Clonostachys solani]
MPQVQAPFVTRQELQEKTANTLAIPNPEPSSATQSRPRWIQGIVKNLTQFNLQVRPPAYFYSGRYETWPTEVGAWSVGQFTCVQSENSASGVTGGNAWNLYIEPGIEVNLAFGFTCPIIGSYKSGVVESATAQDGYNMASAEGNSIVSRDQFSGVDMYGNGMTIMFEVQCSGGQRPVYTIHQVVC